MGCDVHAGMYLVPRSRAGKTPHLGCPQSVHGAASPRWGASASLCPEMLRTCTQALTRVQRVPLQGWRVMVEEGSPALISPGGGHEPWGGRDGEGESGRAGPPRDREQVGKNSCWETGRGEEVGPHVSRGSKPPDVLCCPFIYRTQSQR